MGCELVGFDGDENENWALNGSSKGGMVYLTSRYRHRQVSRSRESVR